MLHVLKFFMRIMLDRLCRILVLNIYLSSRKSIAGSQSVSLVTETKISRIRIMWQEQCLLSGFFSSAKEKQGS